MDKELIKEFVDQANLKSDLESELDSVKRRLAEIEPVLMEQMSGDGVDKFTAHGKTVYIKRELWASPANGNKDEVCQVLKNMGLVQYVSETFNTNSLSAYVREQDAQGAPLAPELAAVVKVSETFRLRLRSV